MEIRKHNGLIETKIKNCDYRVRKENEESNNARHLHFI